MVTSKSVVKSSFGKFFVSLREGFIKSVEFLDNSEQGKNFSTQNEKKSDSEQAF